MTHIDEDDETPEEAARAIVDGEATWKSRTIDSDADRECLGSCEYRGRRIYWFVDADDRLSAEEH